MLNFKSLKQIVEWRLLHVRGFFRFGLEKIKHKSYFAVMSVSRVVPGKIQGLRIWKILRDFRVNPVSREGRTQGH
jgi:hypothetical protein